MKNTLLLGTAVLLLFSCNIKTDTSLLSNLVTNNCHRPADHARVHHEFQRPARFSGN